MLKIELSQYPLDIEIIDDFLIFMIYHRIENVSDLINKKDEEIKEMEGYKPHLLEAVHLIRSIELN